MDQFVAMNMGQLRELTKDVDDDKEIRIWVEMKNNDGAIYLEGRRLIGLTDEQDYCCFCAGYYPQTEESE